MNLVELKGKNIAELAEMANELKVEGGTIRIANKRVDLLNCDAAFGNIQLLP